MNEEKKKEDKKNNKVIRFAKFISLSILTLYTFKISPEFTQIGISMAGLSLFSNSKKEVGDFLKLGFGVLCAYCLKTDTTTISNQLFNGITLGAYILAYECITVKDKTAETKTDKPKM